MGMWVWRGMDLIVVGVLLLQLLARDVELVFQYLNTETHMCAQQAAEEGVPLNCRPPPRTFQRPFGPILGRFGPHRGHTASELKMGRILGWMA